MWLGTRAEVPQSARRLRAVLGADQARLRGAACVRFHLGRSTRRVGRRVVQEEVERDRDRSSTGTTSCGRRTEMPQLNVNNPKYQLAIEPWRKLPAAGHAGASVRRSRGASRDADRRRIARADRAPERAPSAPCATSRRQARRSRAGDLLRWTGRVLSRPRSDRAPCASRVQDVRRARTASPSAPAAPRLTLLLQALPRLSPDRHEVAVPAYTASRCRRRWSRPGFTPRLVDIFRTRSTSPPTRSPTSTARNVLAVIATNLYGMPNDLPALSQAARQMGAFLIDDAAQAMGASTSAGAPAARGATPVSTASTRARTSRRSTAACSSRVARTWPRASSAAGATAPARRRAVAWARPRSSPTRRCCRRPSTGFRT